MIKRLSAILILFVYLPAMLGVGFSTHYCGGEASATKIFSFEKESCCSDEPGEDPCCSDRIEMIKLDKDQLGSCRITVKPSHSLAFTFQVRSLGQKVYSVNLARKSFLSESPPPVSKNISILNCTLLI